MVNTSPNLSLQELKASLIEDLKIRVEDKILEQSNFHLLKKLINNASDKTEAVAIAELGTTYKRTGFHFDKKLEKIGSNIKYLKKNEELSFQTEGSDLTHKLIIGDNYDALLNLTITHRGKIDVVYIDPPYAKDDMGEFADTNYDNAITRDNLLSMLYPRLILAKQLLSEEGVIFCSIDDKNQAYVKCLFDDVFNEENFLSQIAWRRTDNQPNNGLFARVKEYILCYAKNKNEVRIGKLPLSEKAQKEYRYSDEKGAFRRDILLHKTRGRYDYEVKTKTGKTLNGPWMIPEEAFRKLDEDRLIYWTSGGDEQPYGKLYLKDSKGQIPNDFWGIEFGTNQRASVDLESIFGERKFAFSKPVSLIKTLIRLCSDKNSLVMDFFAGSGTTGQAVLELNKEDEGNRTFILCTNNEITDSNPNGIAYDVTSKRLKRVMTGECYDGTNDFEWINKNNPLGGNLDVLDIVEVSSIEQEAEKSAFAVIDEKLYGQDFSLSVEEKIKWVCENFAITQKYLSDSKYAGSKNIKVCASDNLECKE